MSRDLGKPAYRLLAVVLLVVFAAYASAYLVIAIKRAYSHPIGDFFALWSAGRFVLEHPAAGVYDGAGLHAAQVALGMAPETGYPFPYPPSFLLVLAPLGLVSHTAAYAVAIGVTLALYLWATLGRDWRSGRFLSGGFWAALLAPTSTLTIVAGQSGFLEAALLAGGFRLAGARPLCAGVLLGLLTYKPQLGILVPVALVSARLWQTTAAAVVTVAVLAAVTSLLFGPAIWLAWAESILAYASRFAAENSAIAHLMPTLTQAMTALGAAPVTVQVVQALSAITAAGAVWFVFRGGPTRLAAAALFVATFLATPHAFVYDLPIATTGILWLVMEHDRSGAPLAPVETAVLVLALLAPVTLPPGPGPIPLAALSLVLLLAVILRRWRIDRRVPTTMVLAEAA